MVYLTTLIHITVYILFSLGFLANLVVWRSWAYLALLVLCLIQIIIDCIIIGTNDSNSTEIITLANVGMLFLILGVQSIIVRLFHNWAFSMKLFLPKGPKHWYLVWSANAIHILHVIVGIIGIIGLILMGNQATEVTGIGMWQAAIWIYVALAFYVLALITTFGFVKLKEVPRGIDVQRKRNQILLLFFLTLILQYYFISTALGFYYNTTALYICGFSIYLLFLILLYPKALWGFDLMPGENVDTIDPDGAVTVNLITPSEEMLHMEAMEEKELELVGMSIGGRNTEANSRLMTPNTELRTQEERMCSGNGGIDEWRMASCNSRSGSPV